MAYVTSVILETEFFSVIHKTVPELSLRHDPSISFFASTPTIDIEPFFLRLFLYSPFFLFTDYHNLYRAGTATGLIPVYKMNSAKFA